jgi:dihydroflavonol-4-reductase
LQGSSPPPRQQLTNFEAARNTSAPVLISGAAGFIGSAVVRQFVAARYPVRVLVRRSSPRDNLDGLDIELFEGDVRNEADVERAMSGMRYVIHTAADYRLWAREPDEIFHNNVLGTRVIVQAARRQGIARMVYTSSVASLALRRDGEPADERQRLAQHEAIGAYKRSKIAAEEIVAEAIRDGLPAVIVYPTAPVGPRDIRPTPTGRIIIEASSGRMPAYVDTGLNIVHVDDVAAGHLQALVHGEVGARYILGGENVTLAQMLAQIARLRGRRAPRLRVPRLPLFPLAAAAEMMARVTGREPFLTLDGLRMAKYRMFFSSAKAECDLGYRHRPYVEALRDAIGWFAAAGYLR